MEGVRHWENGLLSTLCFVLFFFFTSVRTEEPIRVLEITEAFTAVKSKVCRGGGDLVGLREIISVIFINAQ